jgi:hypothetical protein
MSAPDHGLDARGISRNPATGRRTPLAMPAIQASRRLVKSPPELWAEVSDAASLARHLGEVGEIRITRLEPETTVAWEGETASGTVALAPAGWGTSVTLTAEPTASEAATPEPEPAPEPEPSATTEPVSEPEAIVIEERPQAEPEPTRRGWLARVFRRRTIEAKPSTTDADRAGGGEDARAPGEDPGCARPEPTGPARSPAEPEPEPQPTAEPAQDPLEAVLTHALDSLGQAHHRPFSRG